VARKGENTGHAHLSGYPWCVLVRRADDATHPRQWEQIEVGQWYFATAEEALSNVEHRRADLPAGEYRAFRKGGAVTLRLVNKAVTERQP